MRIDGSKGEGGGQILRTALALSLCLAQPFRIERIRANRARPGLRPQHLAAVRAAQEISRAEVTGDTLGAQTLTFVPGPVVAGDYHFSIGTAGSATLLLQTVLPALLTAGRPSQLRIEGGTHNPNAPTFEFLASSYLPLIERMGPHVQIELERAGFYPVGGGRLRLRVEPRDRLVPLGLTTRGPLASMLAEVLLSKLPRHIADRERAVLLERLPLTPETVTIRLIEDSPGPGNVVTVFIASTDVVEVVSAFGRPRVPAERVARAAVRSAKRYLDADVPVGHHLADQLLLPFALAGGGSFCTLAPSAHTMTNMDVIRQFLPVEMTCLALPDSQAWRVDVQPASAQ